MKINRKKCGKCAAHRMLKKCRILALAGVIGAGTLSSSVAAWAAGPGDGDSVYTSEGGPGAAGAAAAGAASQTGNTAGPGGPGAVGSQTGQDSGSSQNQNSQSQSSQAAAQTDPNAWKKINGVYRMSDGTAINNVLKRGIDVSRWQGDINWSQVAADDVSFVMLGTRSKGAVDPYFHTNIQKASAAGIQVGVYIYSLATTVSMAEEEADFVLDLIHDYPVSYPVAFDMEDSAQGALSKEELAAIANAFCRKISDAGYYPIIYANDNWLANKLDMSLMNYPVWVARYSARPDYANPVMWQATSTGSVNGISGNVDIDFQYKDFSSVIPANTWRTVKGQRYYYSNYAKLRNGWAQDGDSWYYMGSDGLASKGWILESGKHYFLDETTGKMVTGWLSENGKWYYLDGSGALATGWINDGGTWYYSDSQGIMQTGWLDEGGSRYFLRGSGAMATGWRQMDGAWYYFEGSGSMARGMIQVNGVSYYLDPATGKMAADTQVTVDGTVYVADGSGALSLSVQETGTADGESQTAVPAGPGMSSQTAVQSGPGESGQAAGVLIVPVQ